MRNKWNKLASLAMALGLLGCGGSGGEVTGPPEPPEPPQRPERPEPVDPNAREYASQAGLAMVKAGAMHERGGTGRGVQIGIIDIDANPDHRELDGKYDVLEHAPLSPRGDGHGGRVAAVMVAKRDGFGMHGVAYDATLVAYEARGGIAHASLRWLNRQDVGLANISLGSSESITEAIANGTIRSVTTPGSAWRTEAREYVEGGGVMVRSAGNKGKADPTPYAGAPHVAPELERGWLAVVGVGRNGTIYEDSNRCGVAGDWCLAAPGARIYTIEGTDSYINRWGTSLAAPHVTGGIAGLKSLFPNLSFQALRERVLHTADDSGVYANVSVYGQGLLDLDAASRPIGGTNFLSATSDEGAAHSTHGSLVSVGSAFAYGARAQDVLVFDGFQRAPFIARLGSFVTERRTLVSLGDLELDRDPEPAAKPEVGGRTEVRAFAGRDLKQTLGLASGVAHANYLLPRDSIGTALRMNFGGGVFELAGAARPEESTGTPGAGIQGWMPRSVIAATFVPRERDASFGVSFASGLGQPGGIASQGSLATRGHAVDVGYRRTLVLGDFAWASIGGRLAHLVARNRAGIMDSDDKWVAGWTSRVTFELGERTWLSTRMEFERALGSPEVWFRTASGIDASGTISYRDTMLDDGSMSDIDRASVQLVHEVSNRSRFGMGLAAARDGTGTTDAIAGVRYEARF